MPDHDDPAVEAQWCAERRAEVMAYLQREGVDHGRVGDLPTDYVSAETIKHPRDAVRAIAQEWREQARLMANADSHPDTHIGRAEDRAVWDDG